MAASRARTKSRYERAAATARDLRAREAKAVRLIAEKPPRYRPWMCRDRVGRSSSLIRLDQSIHSKRAARRGGCRWHSHCCKNCDSGFQSPKSHHYTDPVEHALIQSRALIRQGWHSFGWMHLKQDLASNAGR